MLLTYIESSSSQTVLNELLTPGVLSTRNTGLPPGLLLSLQIVCTLLCLFFSVGCAPGAIHWYVPRPPVIVCKWSFRTLERPKSATLTQRSSSTSRFPASQQQVTLL